MSTASPKYLRATALPTNTILPPPLPPNAPPIAPKGSAMSAGEKAKRKPLLPKAKILVSPPPLPVSQAPSIILPSIVVTGVTKTNKKKIILIVTGVIGSLLAIWILACLINMAIFAISRSSGTLKSGIEWNKQIIFRDEKQGTKFGVRMEDAWYSDYMKNEAEEEKTTFIVAYSCENLGPREGHFTLAPLDPLGNRKAEIKTDKGNLYNGFELIDSHIDTMLWGKKLTQESFDGWWIKETQKINEPQKRGIWFKIPKNESPTELWIGGMIGETIKVGLPEKVFSFKKYGLEGPSSR